MMKINPIILNIEIAPFAPHDGIPSKCKESTYSDEGRDAIIRCKGRAAGREDREG